MLRKNFKSRRLKRAKEALERQEAWEKLSPSQKLVVLDSRLGKDVGAKKQRAKLHME